MKLRDYQIKLKQDIYQAWQRGAKNVLAQLSTGGGKTVLLADIIAEERGASIAIAHRSEIVSQLALTLGRFGIRHNIIAQKTTRREIIALEISELGRSYFDPQAKCYVAGVDTLIRLDPQTPWLSKITLVVQDEGHHVLQKNKWGLASRMFPQARGLYPTATPTRADGHGLGSHADGIIDEMVCGPSMRDLIQSNYLTDYRIFAPPSDLNLAQVTISASGDYSPPKLRDAVHKSHITGDVVQHYQRFAAGKLGVTFAVDIESATDIAAEFRRHGIPSEVISSKTPDLLRASIMRRFRQREILQIVNVDLLGEGVDVPAIEVISMARPTASYSLYAQQFGRSLRPLPNKTHAIIIDHVNNVIRHGLPDSPRRWSLDRREKKRSGPADCIPLRVCLNVECVAVYKRTQRVCPICGFYSPPQQRNTPEQVDGDLEELNPEVLAAMRGEINRVDNAPRIPQNLDPIAQRAISNRHKERQQKQHLLRASIAQWAGYYKSRGVEDSEIYKTFYFTFGVDIATAQTLSVKESEELKILIDEIVNCL